MKSSPVLLQATGPHDAFASPEAMMADDTVVFQSILQNLTIPSGEKIIQLAASAEAAHEPAGAVPVPVTQGARDLPDQAPDEVIAEIARLFTTQTQLLQPEPAQNLVQAPASPALAGPATEGTSLAVIVQTAPDMPPESLPAVAVSESQAWQAMTRRTNAKITRNPPELRNDGYDPARGTSMDLLPEKQDLAESGIRSVKNQANRPANPDAGHDRPDPAQTGSIAAAAASCGASLSEAAAGTAGKGYLSKKSVLEVHETTIRQIADSIELVHQGGRQMLRVRLKPDSFGEIQIHLMKDGDGLTARIKTDSPETRELLASGAGQLQEALAQKGLNCRQIEILYVGGPAGHQSGSTLGHDTAQASRQDGGDSHSTGSPGFGMNGEPEAGQPDEKRHRQTFSKLDYFA